MFLLFSNLMLVSQQQNCLIFHPLGKRKKEGYEESSEEFLPRASSSRAAVLWLFRRMHALPRQMLQHLQLTMEWGAAAGLGSRVHPFFSSHSLTPAGQKRQAKRVAQPESPERGQHCYWQRCISDPRELNAIWCIDWTKLIISQTPLMSSFNQFGVCLHF